MPVQSKSDGNVSFLPGRSRYNVVTDRSDTWVYHKMSAGSLTGVKPTVVGTPVGDASDPTLMGPGRAEWGDLTAGGLFTLVGNYNKPIVCSAVDASGVTLTLVTKAGTFIRNMPGTFPFVIAPGEYIKAVGGSSVGLLLRIEENTIL